MTTASSARRDDVTTVGLDTEPHPLFSVYSAGNFAEVCPKRISPVAWSLIGDPVERATRALVTRLLPGARWHLGPCYVFVGYVGCRPFHNLSAFCHLARQVPGVEPDDVTAAYFEDAAVPALPEGMDATPLDRAGASGRLWREFVSLRHRLRGAEGRLVRFEQDVHRVLASGAPLHLGAVAAAGRAIVDECWAIHYSTTLGLVPARALQRKLGERLSDHWSDNEPRVSRPRELVWTALHEAAAADGAAGSGGFLAHPFYEIADDHEPWAGFAARHVATASAAPTQEADILTPERIWSLIRFSRVLGLPQLSGVVADTMSSREHSKSLAMRALHAYRLLLPAVAAVIGVDDEDWPYLTVSELLDVVGDVDLPERAATRRVQCQVALERHVPDVWDAVQPDAALLNGSPPAPRRARGVSPGLVTGTVVTTPEEVAAYDGPKVLVSEAADANIQPLLAHVDAVVTARGSVLSHVAILVREYDVPAVVGCDFAGALCAGQTVSLNGSTGEVVVLAD